MTFAWRMSVKQPCEGIGDLRIEFLYQPTEDKKVIIERIYLIDESGEEDVTFKMWLLCQLTPGSEETIRGNLEGKAKCFMEKNDVSGFVAGNQTVN